MRLRRYAAEQTAHRGSIFSAPYSSTSIEESHVRILELRLRPEVIMASFEELKTKYQSVLKVIENEQIRVANLHLQDGKLLMKGTAPSQEASNAVWNEIKRINPRLDDIMAE